MNIEMPKLELDREEEEQTDTEITEKEATKMEKDWKLGDPENKKSEVDKYTESKEDKEDKEDERTMMAKLTEKFTQIRKEEQEYKEKSGETNEELDKDLEAKLKKA